MARSVTVSSGMKIGLYCVVCIVPRVMMGAFPLIIPNDQIMKMKIEEKALSAMKKY